MKVSILKDYDEMSLAAAREVADCVAAKPRCVLGLPTGSTPLGMYHRLAEFFKEGKLSFSGVKTFNLDEYYPIARENQNSYYHFMWENFFGKIDIDAKNVHIPNGEALDPDKECADYEALIENAGGIDLQVLGSGVNGHIGFNEPGEFLYKDTHLTDLTQNTLEVNARFFKEGEKMPVKAMTMGMASILKAGKILLIANGDSKAPALRAALSGKITTAWPISLLQLHQNVVIITDERTASLL